MLMPDYVIKSNSQAAQENSQQDVVNALLMLQKAVHSMHGLSLNYQIGSHCPHCKAFDLKSTKLYSVYASTANSV